MKIKVIYCLCRCPHRGGGWKVLPPPPVRPYQCLGGRITRRPTSDGGTSAGLHMGSASANAPLWPRWPPNPASRTPYSPASNPAPPWYQRIHRGSWLPSLSGGHSPGRRPRLTVNSGETQPRCSWSALGSSLAGSLSPSSHPGVSGSPQSWRPPQRHPRTRAGWFQGGTPAIHVWVGGFSSHTLPLPLGIPGSLPPCWKVIDPSHHLTWSPAWPSVGNSWIWTARHCATQTAPSTAWLCCFPHQTPILLLGMFLPQEPRNVDTSPKSPPPSHYRAVPSCRLPWTSLSSPPTHNSPTSSSKYLPLLLDWPQVTCWGW